VPWQLADAAHTVLSAQVVAHVPSEMHRYCPHAVALPLLSMEALSSALQVAPCVHLPLAALQVNPVAQLPFDVHAVLHAPAAQVEGTHDVGVGAEQAPLPSHFGAVSALSAEHAAMPQICDAPFANPPQRSVAAPSHCFLAQSVVARVSHPAREPCGAQTTGVHVPTCPATSQASH
jgi:hypothetical protein